MLGAVIVICVVAGLVFGLMHWGRGIGTIVSTTVVGMIYMAAYAKIGRLWPLIIAHYLHNLTIFGPFDL